MQQQFDLEIDAISVLEEILDREGMDYDECLAAYDFDLCGSDWCAQCGCIVDKLRRARAALAKASPIPSGREEL